MAYHVLADLMPARLTEAELVQLTNDDADASTVDEDVYAECRADAEAEIDGYLGARYSLPLASTPPLVKRLSITLTIFELFRRRFPEGVPAGRQADADRAHKLLEQLSRGTVTLGEQPEAPVNSERKAQTSNEAATFTRDTLSGF